MRFLAHLLVFSSLALLAIILQFLSGAYAGGFGAQADESAHYVTALMIRDYLAEGLPGNPIDFAKDYYLHYPRVAFGLWPPLFHLVSGVWMFAFGPGRESILALMAMVTATWAFLLFRIVRSIFGIPQAIAASLLLVLLPATQASTMAVMLDAPAALLMLAAAFAYIRYLQTESLRHAAYFGLAAAGAALCKYNGLALALLPPAAVLLARRFHLLRRVSFWLPAGIVMIVAGGWYYAMRRWVIYAADGAGVWISLWEPASRNLQVLSGLAGPAILALAVIGAFWILRPSQKSDSAQDSLMAPAAVSAALIFSVWAFHSFGYPIVEQRYMLPAIPALILLAFVPIGLMASQFRSAGASATAALGIAILPVSAITSLITEKNTASYVKVAEIVERYLPPQGVVMISSDAPGEGMLVSELAMRRHGRDIAVARASKLLADQRLMGQDYKLRVHTPAELMSALDEVPVNVAVVEECSVEICGDHVVLLDEAVRLNARRWRLTAEVPRETGKMIRIYTLSGSDERSLVSLKADMRYTLGVVLQKDMPIEGRRSRSAD